MSVPFVDTDILIRLLTGDDPVKQAASAALFTAVEQGLLTVTAPETVIADAVYVLASPRLYRLPRAQVAALLIPLVQLAHFRVRNRAAVVRALDLYRTTNLDFSDCLLVAAMERQRAQVIYSYDTHFDRVPGIQRREP